MKLRVKLMAIILRNNRLLASLPVIVTYCLIPCVTLSKYFNIGLSEARSIFVYLSQVLLPLCSILWPMGYLPTWIEGDGVEALRACSISHKSCAGEMLLLYGIYLLLIFPTILFAVVLYQVTWLEYVRLIVQICIVISFFYYMAMLCKNVTIGSIPVIAYLFLCFCISGSSDFAAFSIIEPFYFAEVSNWKTLIFVQTVSLILFLWGYLLDRFG